MSKVSIAIVDYGLGNLFSVRRAFEVFGVNNVIITAKPEVVLRSDLVVLPGVGAFEDGMLGLKQFGLDKALYEFAHTGKPLLGICLGMQLFASLSKEFGENEGLGLIGGQVQAIPAHGVSGERLRVPFIGWNNMIIPPKIIRGKRLFDSININKSVYFAHSYEFIPNDSENILATYQYGGNQITAAIQKDNIMGLQFHPEKSGEMGLKILKACVDYSG